MINRNSERIFASKAKILFLLGRKERNFRKGRSELRSRDREKAKTGILYRQQQDQNGTEICVSDERGERSRGASL